MHSQGGKNQEFDWEVVQFHIISIPMKERSMSEHSEGVILF